MMRSSTSYSIPSSPRWSSFLSLFGCGFLYRLLALVIGTIFLAGCGNISVSRYAGTTPIFDPQTFFHGQLSAHGVVKDFSGQVIRHFNADIKGCWQDGIGTLDEQFVFDDGEQQSRIWTLALSGANKLVGTAGDVVGQSTGEWAGNALFMEYVLRVPYGDDAIDLTIDDRMYLVSDSVVINESGMYKFGLKVGEIVLTIVKHSDEAVVCRQS